MKQKPITIRLDERPCFIVGTVIAVYGNAARNLQGLGRCIAAAAISGSFGPFSTDKGRETKLLMLDTLDNVFFTREALDAILDMAESSEALPEGLEFGYKSAIDCQDPKQIRNRIAYGAKELNPDILIISGAEDIPDNVRSLAEVRAALRWFKRVAQCINGIVILEFGLKPSNLIKTALIDYCNYAFLTEEDNERGRITVTATRWEGDPIPTMHIDTDPEGAPTITIDEAEEE